MMSAVCHRSMTSEVIQESDYLQVEPYHAYMRMQVGNERTRPFLIRMKPPGPALYKDSIPKIKKRTIAEAMEIEEQALDEINDKKILQEKQKDENCEDMFEEDHVDLDLLDELTKQNRIEMESFVLLDEYKNDMPTEDPFITLKDKQLQDETDNQDGSFSGQINVRKEVEKGGKMDKKGASLEDALF